MTFRDTERIEKLGIIIRKLEVFQEIFFRNFKVLECRRLFLDLGGKIIRHGRVFV